MKIKNIHNYRELCKMHIYPNDETLIENFIGTSHTDNDGNLRSGFFKMYHGHKPDIAGYLPSVLKIAEDGQAIYEFIQNAVDANSTHFYIFYNENYFLAINNGAPFSDQDLESVLNIAQSNKKSCDKIGRFGIGFKLIHRLVGKNEGVDELVHQLKGPVLFSWCKQEHLLALINGESPESSQKKEDYEASPFLLKMLLTNFPAGPNEYVRDLDFKYRILFPKEELNEMSAFIQSSLEQHKETINFDNLSQGSLFFIKLGVGKKEKLDKDYEDLKKGVQYSMNTLKHLKKVYINNEDISKEPLELEHFEIEKGTADFEKINPEYQDCNIRIILGHYPDYKQSGKLKSSPNFYKYFPLGDETNGFNFIIHCNSFGNESNRRKLHQDELNNQLLPAIADLIIKRLDYYKQSNRQKYLQLYASILLSDIPGKTNNGWLNSIFFDHLLSYLRANVPTQNGCFAETTKAVKIKGLKTVLSLPELGMVNMQWLEWGFENDQELAAAALLTEKLGIPRWGVNEIIEHATIENLSNWIIKLASQAYESFLLELEKSTTTQQARNRLSDIKIFQFSDGQYYAVKDVTNNPLLIFNNKKTIGISAILQKLGFVVSKKDISDYDILYQSLVSKLPGDGKVYEQIASACEFNSLSADEKKLLFQNFTHKDTKFDQVAEGTLKNLILFCNNAGKLEKLQHLIDHQLQTPEWLKPYKIKEQEYFPELTKLKLLITESEIYSKVIFPNWNHIILQTVDIPAFYNRIKYYCDSDEKSIPFEKQKFVHIDTEIGFVAPDDLIYHPDFIKNNRYQEFREIIRRLTGKYIPSKAILSYLEEKPFKLKQTEILDAYLNINESLNLDDLETLLAYCKAAGLSFFNKYTIERNGDSYRMLQRNNAFQIWPDSRATRDFLSSLPATRLKTLPEELNDYQKEYGVYYGEELSELLLKEISVDDYQEALISLIKYANPLRGLLAKITSIHFSVGEKYNTESFEYRLLAVACEYLQEKEYPAFRNKIVIHSQDRTYRIGDIPRFRDSIQMDTVTLNLSRLLPLSYKNSGFLRELIVVFNGLGLSKEKLYAIFGLNEEMALDELYNFLLKDYPVLENEQQLAFLTLYIKDVSPFLVKTLGGNQQLKGSFYTDYHSFLEESSILGIQYKGISELITLPEVKDTNGLILFSSPYLGNNLLVIPRLKGTLTEKERIDLLEFLLSQEGDQKVLGKLKWEPILGFRPNTCINPNTFALEKEQLPRYIQDWMGDNMEKASLLSAIGVWNEPTLLVALRKYFANQGALTPQFSKELPLLDPVMIYHTFEWLKERGIQGKTAQDLAILEEMVKVCQQHQRDLTFGPQYDMERIAQESEEWDLEYYQLWKKSMENRFSIFVFKGKLPAIYKINKFDHVFYYRAVDDIMIDKHNKIYVNAESDIKEQLGKLTQESTAFTIDHLLALYQTKDSVSDVDNEKIKLSEENKKLRSLLVERDEFDKRDTNDVTVQTDEYLVEIQEKSETLLFNLLKELYPLPFYTVNWLNYDQETDSFCERYEQHDFEIINESAHIIHYIECKGTPAVKPTFYLTKNEWEFFLECVRNGNSYHLYRMFNVESEWEYVHINDLFEWLQMGKVVPYLTMTEMIKGGRVFLTIVDED